MIEDIENEQQALLLQGNEINSNEVPEDEIVLGEDAVAYDDDGDNVSTNFGDEDRALSEDSDIDDESAASNEGDGDDEDQFINNLPPVSSFRQSELHSIFLVSAATMLTRAIIRGSFNTGLLRILEDYLREINVQTNHLIFHDRGDQQPRSIPQENPNNLCRRCNSKRSSVLTLCNNFCFVLCDICANEHFKNNAFCYCCVTPYLFGIKVNF